MLVKGFYDGMKVHTSSKGTTFADVFIRGLCVDGTADFEQIKLRTFNEAVIKDLQGYSKDDILNLDLTVRDAFIEGVI